jgi:NRAMP (natural resistance-associated macrophage protein)-like metal ion transporter
MEEKLEDIVSAPSVILEKGIDATRKIGKDAADITRIKKAQGFWSSLGPGLITGAADDDPSGIATYSQTGAQYGYKFLWLAAFTFPLMAIVQEMCARIGLETGRGLAGNIRIHYPRWVLYSCAALLFIANSLNIGADVGAMASAVQLLQPHWSFFILTGCFTFFCLLMQIYTPYEQYAKYLKYLVIALLSYVATAFIVHMDPQELFFHTVIPQIAFTKDQLFIITAILGTTISPYLFFWQTSHEVEEEISHGKTTVRLREGTSDVEVKKMRIDVWIGMFVSNLVMFFIIATCAAVLYSHGVTHIETAADAAMALKPLAGNNAFLLFAAGIIGMGLLAVPVLAGSAAYTVAESFKWKSGLYRKLKNAQAFYGIIILSMLIGWGLNFVGISTINMLIYSAVLNGLVAPVILYLIVQMTNNRHVMKERTNHPIIAFFGWIVTGVMIVSGIATILSLFLF